MQKKTFISDQDKKRPQLLLVKEPVITGGEIKSTDPIVPPPPPPPPPQPPSQMVSSDDSEHLSFDPIPPAPLLTTDMDLIESSDPISPPPPPPPPTPNEPPER